jgi:hypothetical protein
MPYTLRWLMLVVIPSNNMMKLRFNKTGLIKVFSIRVQIFKICSVLMFLHLNSCEENTNPIQSLPPDNEVVPINLIYYDDFKLDVTDFHISIDSSGAIHSATLYGLDEPVGLQDDYISIIYLAGLWLGAYIDGEAHANIIWVGSYPHGNLISKCDSIRTGVYFVDPAILSSEDFTPLTQFGFPTDQNNKPRIFGDAMCWSALETDTSVSLTLFQNPIPDIHITQTLYIYTESEFERVFFLRYEIENKGLFDLEEMYSGFYSDTDLLYYDNATGYDSSRGLSYTYSPRDSIFSSDSYVTGFAFLETPVENGSPVAMGSHRIMRKNNYLNYEFEENGFDTPEQVLFALKGLDNFGNPMINPTTGKETKFAFTGDPILGTGWLDDIPVDVRSLLSTEPFSLKAGEKKTISIVWVVESGNDLSIALENLKGQIDNIRNNPVLWEF